jgi:hypothetical protein
MGELPKRAVNVQDPVEYRLLLRLRFSAMAIAFVITIKPVHTKNDAELVRKLADRAQLF